MQKTVMHRATLYDCRSVCNLRYVSRFNVSLNYVARWVISIYLGPAVLNAHAAMSSMT